MYMVHRSKKYALPIIPDEFIKVAPYAKDLSLQKKKSIDIMLGKQEQYLAYKEKNMKEKQANPNEGKRKSFYMASYQRKRQAQSQERQFNRQKTRIESFLQKDSNPKVRQNNLKANKTIMGRHRSTNLVSKDREQFNDLLRHTKKTKNEVDLSPYTLNNRRFKSTNKIKPNDTINHFKLKQSLSPKNKQPIPQQDEQDEQDEADRDWICQKIVRQEVYGIDEYINELM